TPLYDENRHWEEYIAYRKLKKDQEEGSGQGVAPTKPLPSYAWGYRPEYQFSRYSLELDAINRVDKNLEGQDVRENIIDSTIPAISSSDELIEILYSLIGSEFSRLSPIDGPQDLVLAIG